MTDTARNTAATSAVKLLTHYSFEQGEFTTQQLVDQWLEVYPCQWMHLAVVEALYQGRYKAISVEQILAFWHRRGRPIYRFNGEFERLVCNRFPQKLSAAKDQDSAAVPSVEAESFPTISQARTSTPVAQTDRPDTQKSSTGDRGNLLSRTVGSANTHNSARLTLQETRPQTPAADLPTSATALEDKPVASDSARQAAVASSPGGMEVEQIPPPTEAGVSRVKSRTGNIHQADESGLRQFPIHQFVPRSEPSGFYIKLTAIAVGASRSKY